MNEKQYWTGIAPSPAVLAQLDYEEMAVLALLSWCTATNQPVTSTDVANLSDRDGKPIGLNEARTIVQDLTNMKVVSVYGMSNDRPMSVRLGGFQPRTPKRFDSDRRPPAMRPSGPVPARRPEMRKAAPPRKHTGTPPWVLKEKRVETGLEVTPSTPAYVLPEAARLREMQVRIEGGDFEGTLVDKAKARLSVLQGRIALYERWLRDEPKHKTLAGVLDKKRRAVPEMRFQIERAEIKQQELEAQAHAE